MRIRLINLSNNLLIYITVVKSPVFQNFYIRGRNPRLNSEGRFPMYFLKEHFKFEDSSDFINIFAPTRETNIN